MLRVVIELTNRCNLSCIHCYESRHGGKNELSWPVFENIVLSAKKFGIKEFAFTGGEPTLYRHFIKCLQLASMYDYKFGFVSNGWALKRILQPLLELRHNLQNITFSLDGATRETHDSVRGKGSFNHLLQSVSICIAKGLPFNFNSVLTSANYKEVEETVSLATALGCQGVRFGHYIENSKTGNNSLILPLKVRQDLEKKIQQLHCSAKIEIAMAPGNYSEQLFPCTPLQLKEFNIDCTGNVSTCCQLSGLGKNNTRNIVGNLHNITFDEAMTLLRNENYRFRHQKFADSKNQKFKYHDYLPCLYCMKHYFESNKTGNKSPIDDLNSYLYI